jgi:hypothetical protein
VQGKFRIRNQIQDTAGVVSKVLMLTSVVMVVYNGFSDNSDETSGLRV